MKKTLMRIGRGCGAVACVLLITLATAGAAAQSGGTLNPNAPPPGSQQPQQAPNAAPSPNLRKTYPVWVGYIVIFLMAAGVMAISLMPAKRSHQD